MEELYTPPTTNQRTVTVYDEGVLTAVKSSSTPSTRTSLKTPFNSLDYIRLNNGNVDTSRSSLVRTLVYSSRGRRSYYDNNIQDS